MENWDILRDLPPGDASEIIRASQRRSFARGDVLMAEGEDARAMYLVASGMLLVKAVTEEGRVVSVAIAGPSSFVGELGLIDDSPRVATVIGVEPGEVLVLHRGTFLEMVRKHPSARDVLLRALASKVRMLTDQLLEALFVPADERVRRRVAELAALVGPKDAEAVLHVTQEDVASLAGTTRETVNRVLREEQARGALRTERGRIVVTRR